MKAAIVSLGSVSSQWTLEAMRKYFDEVEDVNLKEIEINLGAKKNSVLYRGEPLGEYDCVYLKGSFRYAPVLRSIASLLPEKTYTPIQSSAFTIGHDKLLTHQVLQVAGVPMPETYIASTMEAAKRMLEKVNYPIVLKFPQGTQGKGVMFAESFASANSVLDALNALNQPFIIQEYIDTNGTDTRAFVVGDKVVAAMKRKSSGMDKRSNLHSGGAGEPCELDNYTKKVALDAAKALGADICGVDILTSVAGPKVIELNLSPGLQGIVKSTKIDVADKIAKALYARTQKISDEKKKKSTKEILKDQGIEDINSGQEIITNLDFRGNRILLPEVITQITRFNEKDDMVVKTEKGKLEIKKFS
ncbi:MAG: ATP-grasp domain-containing protein [Nanobdellota archaeon]